MFQSLQLPTDRFLRMDLMPYFLDKDDHNMHGKLHMTDITSDAMTKVFQCLKIRLSDIALYTFPTRTGELSQEFLDSIPPESKRMLAEGTPLKWETMIKDLAPIGQAKLIFALTERVITPWRTEDEENLRMDTLYLTCLSKLLAECHIWYYI
jgi:hypothetical protein